MRARVASRTLEGIDARIFVPYRTTPTVAEDAATMMDLDAYDVSASDEDRETPVRGGGGAIVASMEGVDAEAVRSASASASASPTKRRVADEETAAPTRVKVARAGPEGGGADDHTGAEAAVPTSTVARSVEEERPMKASTSTPKASTRIAETPAPPRSSYKGGGEIVFKVPSSRVKHSESGAMASVVRVGGASEPLKSVEETQASAPRVPIEDAGRDDAVGKLSPLDEFDFEDELNVSPPREEPPSPGAEEDETAREDIARASARLDELKGRVEEFVLESTELLLDTITTTNDYLLLFNPKLMLKLRKIKQEAVEWLDRAESSKTKD